MTAWWAAVTQWFFGPGLIDRGFRLTGGMCAELEKGRGDAGMNVAEELLTGAACKLAGGRWQGGYDISGHVVLLTLTGAFLGLEILPVVMKYTGQREERLVRNRNGGIERAGRLSVDLDGDRQDGRDGVSFPLMVAGLSWWMLFMTATYFHTWVEKVRRLSKSSAHEKPCEKSEIQNTDPTPAVFGFIDRLSWDRTCLLCTTRGASHQGHYRYARIRSLSGVKEKH